VINTNNGKECINEFNKNTRLSYTTKITRYMYVHKMKVKLKRKQGKMGIQREVQLLAQL